MSNLTDKFADLETILVNQHDELMSALAPISAAVDNLSTAVAAQTIYQQRTADNTADILTAILQVVNNTDRLSTIQGTLEDSKLVLDSVDSKLNDTNDRLAQALVILAAMKLDTAKLEAIRALHATFYGREVFADVLGAVGVTTGAVNQLRSYFFGFSPANYGGTKFADLMTALMLQLTNLVNNTLAIEGHTQLTSAHLLENQVILEAIRDCSCDASGGEVNCDEATGTFNADRIILTDTTEDLYWENGLGQTGSYNLAYIYTWPQFVAENDLYDDPSGPGFASIAAGGGMYGPPAPKACVENNGTTPLTVWILQPGVWPPESVEVLPGVKLALPVGEGKAWVVSRMSFQSSDNTLPLLHVFAEG